MSLREFEAADVVSSPSPTESARFGLATMRVSVGEGALAARGSMAALAAAVEDVVEAGAQAGVSLAILRYPSQVLGLTALIRRSVSRVIPAGTLAYWEAGSRAVRSESADVRHVEGRDRAHVAPQVSAIIEGSFADYTNHYSANPLLDPAAIADGYREWALRTSAEPGNPLFLGYTGDEAVSVAVLAEFAGTWEVELASVVREQQRGGRYSELMAHVALEAASKGRRLVISTQAHNIAVQRAWAKLGWAPIGAVETVHLMLDGPAKSRHR